MADKTYEAAEYVRDAALSRVEAARKTAESAKEKAAERVRSVGATLRKVGEHLRVEDQTYVADKASDVSRRLDDVASYISSAEISTLVRDSEDIAREKPLLFFGGAFVVGLAAGRFLKVTSAAMTGSEPRRPRAARLQSPMVRDDSAYPTSPTRPAYRSPPQTARDDAPRATRPVPAERGVVR